MTFPGLTCAGAGGLKDLYHGYALMTVFLLCSGVVSVDGKYIYIYSKK